MSRPGADVSVSSPPGASPHDVLAGADEPDVFPGGGRLVSRHIDDNKLYVSTIDGTGSRRLTGDMSTAGESAPNVSADGRRVIYEREVGGSAPELTLAEVDTGRTTALGVSGLHPLWSPDGRFLAFSPPDAHPAVVDVVDATGAGQVRLTSAGAATDWSPDGGTLALVTGSGVCTLALGDRSARSLLTPSSSAGVARSYGPSAFSASGAQLYVVTVDDRGKGELIDQRLRRYALSDGSEDTASPPRSGSARRPTAAAYGHSLRRPRPHP